MPTLWFPSLLLSTLFLVLYAQKADAQTDRTMRHFCSGTANGMQMPHGRDRFEDLRQIYQNCTRVFGNIEISDLKASDLNGRSLDFFDDIEEVKGYIMIYFTDLTHISFKNLKIVWGDNLLETASVYVEMNQKLTVINMPSLRSIEKGMVHVTSSPRVCHLKDTVNRDEFLNFNRSRYFLASSVDTYCKEKNTACHHSCNGACWGPGAEDCQTLYRSICPKNACESNQCFIDANTNKARCCHAQCLAGCTGPETKDCVACANFMQCKNENEPLECKCVEQCTSRRRYNNETGQMELNPEGYFPVGGRHCLKECPADYLTEGDECVKECGPGMHYDPNQGERMCRACDGLCPKTCRFEKLLTSENIAQLENCTEIEGFIKVNGLTFQDQIVLAPTEMDPSRTRIIRKLDPKELDVLKTVRFISHYVYIATADSPLRSLSFLENLEFIEGRSLYSNRNALVVSKNDNLEFLGLRSLKQIGRGDVIISSNYHLCHADNYKWKEIVAGKDNFAKVAQNKYDCSEIPSSSHL